MEELTVQVAVRLFIHRVSMNVEPPKLLGNDNYSKDKIDRWFMKRRWKAKSKERKSLKDLSNVANTIASDSPAPTPPPPPIPAPKTKRPRKKRAPKPIDISHHATLAVLCAEVSYQSAQNLAPTWASILKCDQELLNAWIDDYYGASVSSTDIPIPAPEPEQVLQDPVRMEDIDADTTLVDEPIQFIDESVLARIPPPSLKICPYKGSTHLPSPTSPYYKTMFAWGSSYKSPKSPHEHLFREITKNMDAADMDVDCQRTSMSLDEFNARMEPVLDRVKDLLGRLGRGEQTCIN